MRRKPQMSKDHLPRLPATLFLSFHSWLCSGTSVLVSPGVMSEAKGAWCVVTGTTYSMDTPVLPDKVWPEGRVSAYVVPSPSKHITVPSVLPIGRGSKGK